MTDLIPFAKAGELKEQDDLVKRLRDKNCCDATKCNCDEAADRIEQVESIASPNLTSSELKIIEKNCDWVAFQHAFGALMKHRRAALGEKKDG